MIKLQAKELRPISLLLAAACAGSPGLDRSATFLSTAPPPQGRPCRAAVVAATLPTVAAVVDSQALVTAARGVPGAAPGSVLFSLRFDEHGRITSIRAIESTLAAGPEESMSRATVGALKPQSPGQPWSVRLKVTTGDSSQVRIGRSEVCPAVLSGGPIDVVVSRTVVSSGGAPPSPQPERATPHFQLLVDSTGRLVTITLTRSSGQTDVDQQLESALRDKSFRPTLLDGAPILAWTEWPLRPE